jgi:hypothetical protein
LMLVDKEEEIRQQGKSYTVLTNKYCSVINPTSQYLFKISSKFYSVSQKMKTCPEVFLSNDS